jgi:hypothetical protein
MYSITYYYKDKTTDLNKEFDKLYQIQVFNTTFSSISAILWHEPDIHTLCSLEMLLMVPDND